MAVVGALGSGHASLIRGVPGSTRQYSASKEFSPFHNLWIVEWESVRPSWGSLHQAFDWPDPQSSFSVVNGPGAGLHFSCDLAQALGRGDPSGCFGLRCDAACSSAGVVRVHDGRGWRRSHRGRSPRQDGATKQQLADKCRILVGKRAKRWNCCPHGCALGDHRCAFRGSDLQPLLHEVFATLALRDGRSPGGIRREHLISSSAKSCPPTSSTVSVSADI